MMHDMTFSKKKKKQAMNSLRAGRLQLCHRDEWAKASFRLKANSATVIMIVKLAMFV